MLLNKILSKKRVLLRSQADQRQGCWYCLPPFLLGLPLSVSCETDACKRIRVVILCRLAAFPDVTAALTLAHMRLPVFLVFSFLALSLILKLIGGLREKDVLHLKVLDLVHRSQHVLEFVFFKLLRFFTLVMRTNGNHHLCTNEGADAFVLSIFQR